MMTDPPTYLFPHGKRPASPDDLAKINGAFHHENKRRSNSYIRTSSPSFDESSSESLIRGPDWLELQFHDQNRTKIIKPNQLEKEMRKPGTNVDARIFNRIAGSMLGMAIGDALGAPVEFRPRDFLIQNPVTDLMPGGTWGLEKGQVPLSLSLPYHPTPHPHLLFFV